VKHMILPPLTGVFAAALLGGCAAASYDSSMNSCDQEYMMTNPAGAEYYCGPGYGYPLYELRITHNFPERALVNGLGRC